MRSDGLALMIGLGGPDEAADSASILKRAKAGDLAAFEQMIRLHERRVLATALRLLGRLEDAEDAAQEVFLRLHRHLRRFDDSRDFAPWLYRITVNVCHDLAKRRRPEVPVEEVAPEEFSTPPADLLPAERQRAVAEALLRLPEKERAALVLHDLEELPTSEVARILGSSPATVRSQVAAARLKIRKLTARSWRKSG